jgi:hypothetical protein
MKRLISIGLALVFFQPASAALIDGFSVGQGPFTVGPGEEITEEQGILETDAVLGGFRFMAPGLDDEAPAGSTVTVGVAGGEFRCEINLTASHEETGGGCGTGWARGDGPLFDLSGSSAFEMDITSVGGATAMAVFVFGPSEEMALAFIESPTVGSATLPFSQFAPMTGTAPAWDEINTIVISAAAIDGNSGHVALGRFATDGPITGGAHVPTDANEDDEGPDPDHILRDEISGSYFNPSRDGEGLRLTREADDETFILTYYTYLDGEQVWLIGVGALMDGQLIFDQMSITEGPQYGSNYDSGDYEARDWGEIVLDFRDCNRMTARVNPDDVAFEPIVVDLTRITPVSCGAGAPPDTDQALTGTMFDPARNGEGFQIVAEGDRYIITFYTYDGGEQMWMIGVGDRSGNVVEFPAVYITSGTDFGGQFRPWDVSQTLFGSITVEFSNCNAASVKVEPVISGFDEFTSDAVKIVDGPCP